MLFVQMGSLLSCLYYTVYYCMLIDTNPQLILCSFYYLAKKKKMPGFAVFCINELFPNKSEMYGYMIVVVQQNLIG